MHQREPGFNLRKSSTATTHDTHTAAAQTTFDKPLIYKQADENT